LTPLASRGTPPTRRTPAVVALRLTREPLMRRRAPRFALEFAHRRASTLGGGPLPAARPAAGGFRAPLRGLAGAGRGGRQVNPRVACLRQTNRNRLFRRPCAVFPLAHVMDFF